jgi:hypothetical protein
MKLRKKNKKMKVNSCTNGHFLQRSMRLKCMSFGVKMIINHVKKLKIKKLKSNIMKSKKNLTILPKKFLMKNK